MKETLKKKIDAIVKSLFNQKVESYDILVPEREEFGDLSTNVAFILAKKLGKNPREIAQSIVDAVNKKKILEIEKSEIAGAGFINFFISSSVYEKEVNVILKNKSKYGSNDIGKGKKVQVEFISANPTGPMTLGNGRGGFSGDTLANVLKKNGFNVKREYFINDTGNQVKGTLAKSIFRALDLDVKIEEGEDLYGGDYIDYIARKIKKQKGIDWIKKNFEKSGEAGAKIILEDFIKKDIKYLGIKYDRWFSEKSLHEGGLVEKMWRYLKVKKLVYEQDGAYWLKTSEYGDDKDRVIKKSNGYYTYMMGDIAYMYDRLSIRKFDKVIMILGADHHGYLGRFMAVADFLGHREKLNIVLAQLVRLSRNGVEVKMSKRKGNFITLREIAEDIGVEAARYFFISKDFNHHLDIDLDIAKAQNSKNPIYYIQYSSARINSVLAKIKTKPANKATSKIVFDKYETTLIKKLAQYPGTIREVGESYQVYKIAFYAYDLAESFHKFYDHCRIVGDPREEIRLKIVKATKVVLDDALGVMGIKPKKKM